MINAATFVWDFNPLLLIVFLFSLFSPCSKTFSFREGGLLSHTQWGFHPSFWDGAPTSGNLWFRNRWNYGSWPTQQALFVPDSKRLSENMMIFMGDGKIRRWRYEYLWFKKRKYRANTSLLLCSSTENVSSGAYLFSKRNFFVDRPQITNPIELQSFQRHWEAAHMVTAELDDQFTQKDLWVESGLMFVLQKSCSHV